MTEIFENVWGVQATGGTEFLGGRGTVGWGISGGFQREAADGSKGGVEWRSSDFDGGEYRTTYQKGMYSLRITYDGGMVTGDVGIRKDFVNIPVGTNGSLGTVKGQVFGGIYANTEGIGVAASGSFLYEKNLPIPDTVIRGGVYGGVRILVLKYDELKPFFEEIGQIHVRRAQTYDTLREGFIDFVSGMSSSGS
jgi:hypothetical protein